jgi:hypothetical protein
VDCPNESVRFANCGHELHERQSGAKATAVQALARLLVGFQLREASGLRRVHRRFWAAGDYGRCGGAMRIAVNSPPVGGGILRYY